jgi:NAD(P)-dependent dehydrogenase (short-subunit alcohol dehydrogenase family)
VARVALVTGGTRGDRRRGLGKPDEIARAVVFPAAEEAGFVTGSTLSINGGQHMS